jgi:hypothetical protein
MKEQLQRKNRENRAMRLAAKIQFRTQEWISFLPFLLGRYGFVLRNLTRLVVEYRSAVEFSEV